MLEMRHILPWRIRKGNKDRSNKVISGSLTQKKFGGWGLNHWHLHFFLMFIILILVIYNAELLNICIGNKYIEEISICMFETPSNT